MCGLKSVMQIRGYKSRHLKVIKLFMQVQLRCFLYRTLTAPKIYCIKCPFLCYHAVWTTLRLVVADNSFGGYVEDVLIKLTWEILSYVPNWLGCFDSYFIEEFRQYVFLQRGFTTVFLLTYKTFEGRKIHQKLKSSCQHLLYLDIKQTHFSLYFIFTVLVLF